MRTCISREPVLTPPRPHAEGLAPELVPVLIQKARRKGKGGRTPAADPRLDPNMDPKKAKRILANRQSAARSKLKQVGLRQRMDCVPLATLLACACRVKSSAQCASLRSLAPAHTNQPPSVKAPV